MYLFTIARLDGKNDSSGGRGKTTYAQTLCLPSFNDILLASGLFSGCNMSEDSPIDLQFATNSGNIPFLAKRGILYKGKVVHSIDAILRHQTQISLSDFDSLWSKDNWIGQKGDHLCTAPLLNRPNGSTYWLVSDKSQCHLKVAFSLSEDNRLTSVLMDANFFFSNWHWEAAPFLFTEMFHDSIIKKYCYRRIVTDAMNPSLQALNNEKRSVHALMFKILEKATFLPLIENDIPSDVYNSLFNWLTYKNPKVLEILSDCVTLEQCIQMLQEAYETITDGSVSSDESSKRGIINDMLSLMETLSRKIGVLKLSIPENQKFEYHPIEQIRSPEEMTYYDPKLGFVTQNVNVFKKILSIDGFFYFDSLTRLLHENESNAAGKGGESTLPTMLMEQSIMSPAMFLAAYGQESILAKQDNYPKSHGHIAIGLREKDGKLWPCFDTFINTRFDKRTSILPHSLSFGYGKEVFYVVSFGFLTYEGRKCFTTSNAKIPCWVSKVDKNFNSKVVGFFYLTLDDFKNENAKHDLKKRIRSLDAVASSTNWDLTQLDDDLAFYMPKADVILKLLTESGCNECLS